MAELHFDATKYTPKDDADSELAYTLRPTTHSEYVEACQARKQLQEAAKSEWRKAVHELHAAKANVAAQRAKYDEAKALPPVKPPYYDILAAGGTVLAPEGD